MREGKETVSAKAFDGTIDERVWNSTHTWYYEHIFAALIENEAHRLRMQIRITTFPGQCFARLERWNSEEWKEVHSISGYDFPDTGISPNSKNITVENFRKCGLPRGLMRVAARILSSDAVPGFAG